MHKWSHIRPLQPYRHFHWPIQPKHNENGTQINLKLTYSQFWDNVISELISNDKNLWHLPKQYCILKCLNFGHLKYIDCKNGHKIAIAIKILIKISLATKSANHNEIWEQTQF